jgi:hypothetical protein
MFPILKDIFTVAKTGSGESLTLGLKARCYCPTYDFINYILVPMVAFADCQTSLQGTRLTSTFRLHSSFICAGKVRS